VISGTEQLFAAGGAAVVVFWTFMGIGAGIAASGLATYFLPAQASSGESARSADAASTSDGARRRDEAA
jgi:hypothetical protein